MPLDQLTLTLVRDGSPNLEYSFDVVKGIDNSQFTSPVCFNAAQRFAKWHTMTA